MEDGVQGKNVGALGVPPVVNECAAVALGEGLEDEQRPQSQDQVVKQEQQEVTKQDTPQVEEETSQLDQREKKHQQGEQQQERMTEWKKVEAPTQEKTSGVRDSQQELQQRQEEVLETQQQLSDVCSSEMEGGRGGMGEKQEEDLFLSSSMSGKGCAEHTEKGGGKEHYHHGKGELRDEEEEEEEQQFPSTVDSVASSTASGNAFGGARTVARFARRHTDCETAASISQYWCAQAARSISSTPLLTAAGADTSPTIAAFCDDTVAPPLQLPLPAPQKKSEQLTTTTGEDEPPSETTGDGGERGVAAVAAGAEGRAPGAGDEKEKDAAAEVAAGRKDDDIDVKDQAAARQGGAAPLEAKKDEAGSATPGSAAVVGEGLAGAGAAAACVETEVGGGGKGGQAGTEAAALKTAVGEGDARGKAAAGRDDTGAQLSFWMQSRRKQSVAEQGRIAAAAVAAATRLFNRGEAASSSCRVEDQAQQSQLSMGLARGKDERSFSVAVAGPTSCGLSHLQHEQQQQQQRKDSQKGDDGGRWRQHMQQQEKRTHLSEGEVQEQQQERDLQHLQQTEEEKPQEPDKQAQRDTSHSSAIEFFAAELQEEERKMLKAFCGEDEGEIEAGENSCGALLSAREFLFSARTSVEPGQQQPTPMDRWWGRRSSEIEHRSEFLLGRSCLNSSSVSLQSFLQSQQKDAPALLFSTASLQHDTSTKHSSLATFSPRKLSPCGGFFAAGAAAVSRDIPVATPEAIQEAVPMAREEATQQEEAGRGISGKRGDEDLTTDFAGLFQRPEGETDIRGLSLPLTASSVQDMMLPLDFPRVLSLATQASPVLKDPSYTLQQQPPAAVAFSKTSSAAAAASQYASAAAALAGGGSAASSAGRTASALHGHLSAASSPEASSGPQHPFLRPEAAAAATAVAAAEGVVGACETAEACLPCETAAAAVPGADGGDTTTPPSPVRSLCLQAAVRPPPGFDAKAAEWPMPKVEHCNSDASGVSTTAGTTASAALVSATSPAASLFASASQESIAAAVAVLAAVAAAPTAAVGSGAAAVPTETAYGGGESPGAAATAVAAGRDRLLSIGDAFGAAAAPKTAAGDLGSSCSNANAGASLTAAASYSRGSSSLLPQRDERSSPDSCRSGSPFDTASKQLLLAALTCEAAAAGIPGTGGTAAGTGGSGGAALAAAAAARQAAALAVRAGEKQTPLQLLGGACGAGGTKAAAGVAAARYFGEEGIGVGGRGSNRAGFPSSQGGVRSVSAGETENRAGGLLLGKQPQLLPLSKHRNSQQQQERVYVRRRGGTEAGGGGLRLYEAAPEARGTTERRAVTEVRAVTEGRGAEGGRAAGGASSSFSAYGGRGVYNCGTPNGNSGGSRQAWLRKGEYLELLQQQQQLQHGSSTRSVYGRGQGERTSRRAAAAAAREKAALEQKKDGFKVFFGNASALTTEEEMYGLFRQFGECSELILLRDRRQRLRGAGFVTFRNAADAMRAIEGLDRKYTVLDVSYTEGFRHQKEYRIWVVFVSGHETTVVLCGGTKPLEVRIPENSEQKRERIRALARMRAETAQQQSQEQQQQQQHGSQQQQEHAQQQQQQHLGYSPRSQYTQQRYSFSQQYGGAGRHPQRSAASQRQDLSQSQQQYIATQQQPHAFYEQQMRGAPLQRAQQQHGYYHEQQQRRRASLQRAQGYALGGAGERIKEDSRKETMWRAADARLRPATNRSGGSSPKQEKTESPGADAVSHSAAALEALLVVAAAQQQKQQREQDYNNRIPGENGPDGAQELLAWVQEYTRREDRRGFATFPDPQQQRDQHPHLQQQKEGFSTASKLAASSLYQAPRSVALCSDTLHGGGSPVDHAAPAGTDRMEEQEFYRETSALPSAFSQGCPPSLALSEALAAAFTSLPSGAAAANGVVSERMSDSSETPGAAGAALWPGPLSGIDQKTAASYFACPPAVDRCPRTDAAAPECIMDAFPSTSCVTAGGDEAATTNAHPRNGALTTAFEEQGIAYINAVANMLTSRNNCIASGPERESPDDSQSSRAVAGRYGTSPCAYAQAPACDTASVLQSAAEGSPAAPLYLPSFPAVEKSVPVNGDVYDNKASAAGATLSSLGGLRFPLPQPQDGGGRFPPDLFCGTGKVSESWIKKLSLLRETD